VCRNLENPAAFAEADGTRSVPTTFRNRNQLVAGAKIHDLSPKNVSEVSQ
jgi:hypothetical protein